MRHSAASTALMSARLMKARTPSSHSPFLAFSDFDSSAPQFWDPPNNVPNCNFLWSGSDRSTFVGERLTARPTHFATGSLVELFHIAFAILGSVFEPVRGHQKSKGMVLFRGERLCLLPRLLEGRKCLHGAEQRSDQRPCLINRCTSRLLKFGNPEWCLSTPC